MATTTVVLAPDTLQPETVEVSFGDRVSNAPTRLRIFGRAVSAIDSHTITSGPTRIVPGMRLRLGYGLEEAAWHFDSPPVTFVVEALVGDDSAIELQRRVLDPRRVSLDRGWVDVDLDLAALVDRNVDIRLRTKPSRPGPVLAVWADPRLLAPSVAPRPANLVLVSLDTVRFASTTPYDSALETTPALAELLAARGTVARQAIAPFPHTLPPHMSLSTGLYHRTHGVRSIIDRLPSNRQTLPEALRRAGRVSAAFTENGFLSAASGFWRGFSRYVENKSPDLHKPNRQARATTDAGLAWLHAHHDEPFFLFLHTSEAHWPCEPGPEHDHLFVNGAPPPFGMARALLRYHQEIGSADDQRRRLLGALDELQRSYDTLVVVGMGNTNALFGSRFTEWASSDRAPSRDVRA